MTRALKLLFCGLLLAYLACGCGWDGRVYGDKAATAESDFWCTSHAPDGSCSIWRPDLISSPSSPIAATYCVGDPRVAPAAGYTKIWTQPNRGGFCMLLYGGATQATFGDWPYLVDWNHAAGTGDGIPAVHVQSLWKGPNTWLVVNTGPNYSGYNAETYNGGDVYVPDFRGQPVGSLFMVLQ
jgi:hypothetical protein